MSYFEDFQEPHLAEDLMYGEELPSYEKPVFTRGYKVVREKMKHAGKFMRSCFNCMYYGKEDGSEGEVCLNDDVTEYDLIVEGNIVSCTQWTPYTEGLKKKNHDIFGIRKKTGRNRLD